MATDKDKELKELLSTPEGRKKLADGMVQPVRCGGVDYVDGQKRYRAGGRYWTQAEWDEMIRKREDEWDETISSVNVKRADKET